MRVFIISLNADLASSNNLVKHFWAERAAAHNAQVLESGTGVYIVILDAPCQAHIINRIQAHGFKSAMLIGKIYNLCFTLNNINKWAIVRKGLEEVVSRDLLVNTFLGQRPPPQYLEHSQRVLEATYLRHRHTRSKGPGSSGSRRDDDIKNAASMLLEILNGDWKAGALQHWCWSSKCPCKRRHSTLVPLTVSLLERVVFEPISQRTPSTSRWHTYGPAFEGACLGKFLNNILQRALDCAGPLHRENEEGQANDSEDWRELCNTKAKDAIDFVGLPETARSLSVACIATEPLELLSMRLQHADETGHAVDLLLSDSSAVRDCLKHLYLMLQPADHLDHGARTDWPVDMVVSHLGFSAELADHIVDTVARMASQVWARLHNLSNVWDWRILLLGSRSGDGPFSTEDQALLDAFLREDGCCLGAWCTEWIQKLGQEYLSAGDRWEANFRFPLRPQSLQRCSPNQALNKPGHLSFVSSPGTRQRFDVELVFFRPRQVLAKAEIKTVCLSIPEARCG